MKCKIKSSIIKVPILYDKILYIKLIKANKILYIKVVFQDYDLYL